MKTESPSWGKYNSNFSNEKACSGKWFPTAGFSLVIRIARSLLLFPLLRRLGQELVQHHAVDVGRVGLCQELVRRAVRALPEALEVHGLDVRPRPDGDEVDHDPVHAPARELLGRVLGEELLVLLEELERLRDPVPLVQVVAGALDVEHPVDPRHGRLHAAPEAHHVAVVVAGVVIGEDDAPRQPVALPGLDHLQVPDQRVGRVLAVRVHAPDDVDVGGVVGAPVVAGDDVAGVAEVLLVVPDTEPGELRAGLVEQLGGAIARLVVDDQHLELVTARLEQQLHVVELVDESGDGLRGIEHGRENPDLHGFNLLSISMGCQLLKHLFEMIVAVILRRGLPCSRRPCQAG